MKVIENAHYTMLDAEYCSGCDQVSSYTGTCHGTDQ